MTLLHTARPKRDGNLVSRTISGQTVLIPIRSGAADLDYLFVLNDTAAVVWELLDGARTVTEILDSVMRHFDIDKARAEKDLEELLDGLKNAGLVELPSQ